MLGAKLKSLFGGLSGAGSASARLSVPKPQDHTFDGPPKAQGDWGMIVDKYGDEIIGRKAGANDFIARWPMEYDFRGTIPAYDPNDYHSHEESISAAMEHATRNHRNATLLKKAVFLLSQTDDGRRLLSAAKRNEFHFVFDEDRMKEEGAVGMCDYGNKQIPLAEGRSPEEVALTLKHELQHMEDIKNGITYNASHTLTSSLMGDRALEANARVSEAVLAAEILHGSPKGPDRQFRTNAVFARFHRKNTPIAERAVKALESAKAGNWKEFARSTFDGYFDQHSTLDYYDKRQAEMYERALPEDPNTVFDPLTDKKISSSSPFQTREEMIEDGKKQLETLASDDYWPQNQELLKEKITIKGFSAYITAEDNIDLSDARHTGFGEKAQKLVGEILSKAKIFIPNTIEQLETALSSPHRETTTQMSSAAVSHDAKAEEFNMIQHPDRHDGGSYLGSDEHAQSTRHFKEAFDGLSGYKPVLERISLTLERIHDNGGSNMRGVVRRMVDAGFRAPVAAMPEEYIMHLCRCADYAVKSGNVESAFDQQDLVLMKHWSEMAEHGLDPIYGNEELKKDAVYFERDCLPYVEGYLQPFFDTLQSKHEERQTVRQQTAAAPA